MRGSAGSDSARAASSSASVTGAPSMDSGRISRRVGSRTTGDAASGGEGLGGGPKLVGGLEG